MGGGTYALKSAEVRSRSVYSKMSRQETFTSRSLDPEMDIRGKVRESCDSDEHPNSFPVIIALDVTGSMGSVPHELIKGGFPKIMGKIMGENIPDVQVCFLGIGDDVYDSAPFQAGQFETSDELNEKWLTKVYIESGGGGNDGESYSLAWYFAARHTAIDSYEKRKVKGCLITIGDEPCLPSTTESHIYRIFGEHPQSDVKADDILSEASEKWDCYHINVCDYAGSRSSTVNDWQQRMKDKLVTTQSSSGTDIPDIIAGIVIRCWKSQNIKSSLTAPVVSPSTDIVPASDTDEQGNHLR